MAPESHVTRPSSLLVNTDWWGQWGWERLKEQRVICEVLSWRPLHSFKSDGFFCGFFCILLSINLEWEMATHFIILAWRIPWTKKLDGLWSMGSQIDRPN